jgi:hypothetical protein
MTKQLCSICFGPLAIGRELANGWLQGNNAQPINNGRCCERCNATIVLPARIQGIRNERRKKA